MAHTIVDFFRELIANDYLTTIIISMLPIVEVRGAIPIALTMGMHPFWALMTAFLGSSFVVPFLLLLLRPILDFFKKIKFFNKIALALEEIFIAKAEKVKAKSIKLGEKADGELAMRYKLIAIFTFVSIPLPFTGVWTGSAIAAFLNIKFKFALIVILIGNFVAASLMTVISLFFIDYLDVIITVFFIFIALIIIYYLYLLLYKTITNKKNHNA